MRRALATAAALVLALAPATIARAQGTVTMSADRTEVEVGDTIRLTIQAELRGGGMARVEPPDLGEFDVIGRSTQQSIGFGQATIVHHMTLRARQPGTFRIGPAAVLTTNGRIESDTLTIQVGDLVTDPDARPTPTPTTEPPAVLGADGTVFDPAGFVRTVVDQAEPYVGQQVTVTVYLYVRDGLHGGLTITQEPTTDGFWVHDLLPPNRALDGQPQTVRGVTFMVYVLRRFAAFPLREGELTIGPTSVSMGGGGFFGSIFGPAPQVQRTGVPVTIRARPLPAQGRPSGEVHVGALELAAELDRAQVATGDAVQLTVTARGTGPLHELRMPAPSASGLRVLQPEIDDRVEAPGDLVGGTRQIRWLLVPEREGTYTLGPFEVPVFDPRSGTYAVARAPALRLTAAGNPSAPSADSGPSAAEEESEGEREGLELGPIRSRSALSRSHRTLLDAPWVPYAFGAGPLALVLALLVRVARRRAANGAAAAGPKNARREAKRRLAAADRHAAAGEPREFYAAIAQALKELLEAKLGRPVGSLTHAELGRALVARGMREELAQRVVDELESCDFARFSAAGIRGEEMESCLARTKELLGELDRFTATKEEEP